jgi:arginine repressor
LNPTPLNDKAWTPERVAEEFARISGDAETAVVVFKTKEGQARVLSSYMTSEQIAYLSKVLDRDIFFHMDEAAHTGEAP